jgi:photosystem II stability/assembly factor-like uncharacterized protein
MFAFLGSLTLAQAQHWTPIDSPDFNQVTEALSVSFADDGVTGYSGVGINGVGSQIFKTTDGAKTWTSVWPDADTKNPGNLFLASATKSTTQTVVTGVLVNEFTTDGTKFTGSSNDFLSPAQDVEIMKGGDFATVLFGGKVNGVAISRTGAVWTNHDMGVNSTLWPARYGSFPSASTWYVSAGNFPTSNVDNLHEHNSKFGRDKSTGRVHYTFDRSNLGDPVNCSEDPTNCYSAGVFKTTDAGSTWQQVYSNINTGDNIYPNDIDCFDESNCVMAVEGDTCRIVYTNDGGSTWNEAQRDTDSACSLIYVAMLSASETWVAGGHLSALDFEGRYWHSTDSSATYTKEAVKGLYILDLDMGANFGYSLGLTASGSGVQLLGYTANP